MSRWQVRFTFDRLAMRVKHRAVDSVNLEVRNTTLTHLRCTCTPYVLIFHTSRLNHATQASPPYISQIVYPEAIANSRALQTNVAFVDVHIADNAKQSLALRSMLARRNQVRFSSRHRLHTTLTLTLTPYITHSDTFTLTHAYRIRTVILALDSLDSSLLTPRL